jgi:hypothetical protein
MKNLLLPLLLISCLFFSSCFDIQETYTLKEDGSYDVQYDIDMSELIELASSFASDSLENTESAKEVKDTLMNLGNSMPDSIKRNFTAEELSLLSKTDLRMLMDMPNSVMKFSIMSKGKSTAELNYFLNNFSTLMKKAEVDKKMGGNSLGADTKDDSGSPWDTNGYKYTVTSNLFERKTDTSKLKVDDDKVMASLKMLKGMGIKVTNTVILNLPRPVKQVNDPRAVLSADKKQVKLTLDLLENIDSLKSQHFLVNY